MPKWDFACPKCGHTEEHTFMNVGAANAATLHCPKCNRWLRRQPAAPSFHVTGFNAQNGYSK